MIKRESPDCSKAGGVFFIERLEGSMSSNGFEADHCLSESMTNPRQVKDRTSTDMEPQSTDTMKCECVCNI